MFVQYELEIRGIVQVVSRSASHFSCLCPQALFPVKRHMQVPVAQFSPEMDCHMYDGGCARQCVLFCAIIYVRLHVTILILTRM